MSAWDRAEAARDIPWWAKVLVIIAWIAVWVPLFFAAFALAGGP